MLRRIFTVSVSVLIICVITQSQSHHIIAHPNSKLIATALLRYPPPSPSSPAVLITPEVEDNVGIIRYQSQLAGRFQPDHHRLQGQTVFVQLQNENDNELYSQQPQLRPVAQLQPVSSTTYVYHHAGQEQLQLQGGNGEKIIQQNYPDFAGIQQQQQQQQQTPLLIPVENYPHYLSGVDPASPVAHPIPYHDTLVVFGQQEQHQQEQISEDPSSTSSPATSTPSPVPSTSPSSAESLKSIKDETFSSTERPRRVYVDIQYRRR